MVVQNVNGRDVERTVYVVVYESDGLMIHTGELEWESREDVRYELYDSLALVTSGVLELSGEIRQTTRDRVRMFTSRKAFLWEYERAVRHNPTVLSRRPSVVAKSDAVAVNSKQDPITSEE